MNERIKKKVREILTKDSCGCGCNTCHTKIKKTTISLNENKTSPSILSEGLRYHISKNLPLTEQLYRAGSQNYFNLWAEARSLYSRGILEINDPNDLEIIRETNLGEFGVLEDGTKVPLDFPMLEEKSKLLKEGTYEHALYELDKAGLTGEDADYGGMIATAVLELIKTFSNQGHSGFSASMVREIFNKLSNFETLTEITSNPEEWENRTEMSDGQVLFQNKRNPAIFSEDGGKTWWNVNDKIIKESIKYAFKSYKTLLTESKKENKPIGKPMRDSSGGKAYKVYVRDPKTKKIKTVRFGSGGLRAKINDPKARKAFAKRHRCGTGEPRTSPRYWSCRLPRFSKLLGLKSNFTGFLVMKNLKKLIQEVIQEQKRDRCLRIADRKFDKPSAYKSGAVVRCRKGDIWKDLKEIGDANTKIYPFSKTKSTAWKTEYEFITDQGTEYIVKFDIESYHDNIIADLSFFIKGSTELVKKGEISNIFLLSTNKGELFSVMSTIIQIIKEFLKENQDIIELHFSASQKSKDDNRRFNLYKAYIEKNLNPNEFDVETLGNHITIKRK